MPDGASRKPSCDKPGCVKSGVEYVLDDARRRVRVVLCGDHDYHVLEAMGWGVPAGARARSGGQGLSTERLRGLISKKDDQ